jgi:hypothetical protein
VASRSARRVIITRASTRAVRVRRRLAVSKSVVVSDAAARSRAVAPRQHLPHSSRKSSHACDSSGGDPKRAAIRARPSGSQTPSPPAYVPVRVTATDATRMLPELVCFSPSFCTLLISLSCTSEGFFRHSHRRRCSHPITKNGTRGTLSWENPGPCGARQ